MDSETRSGEHRLYEGPKCQRKARPAPAPSRCAAFLSAGRRYRSRIAATPSPRQGRTLETRSDDRRNFPGQFPGVDSFAPIFASGRKAPLAGEAAIRPGSGPEKSLGALSGLQEQKGQISRLRRLLSFGQTDMDRLEKHGPNPGSFPSTQGGRVS